MKEMIVMMAKIMPQEEIISKIDESLQDYKLFEKEEDLKAVVMFSQILSLKLMMEHEKLSVSDIIKDMDEMEHLKTMVDKAGSN